MSEDKRHHLGSMLARESLIDKDLQGKTESPIFRMLPLAQVVKVGGRSIMDRGRAAAYPLVDVLGTALEEHKLILGTGGGARTRHVFSIASDLGMPTGVLAQLAMADALGTAHMLGTLLAPHGVVAIPPAMFGHLLPLFLKSAPGVIYNGVPPYSLWEHPPKIGRIPPHRTDAGCLLLAECFGCKGMIYIKDVDGLYDADPNLDGDANFIADIHVSELKAMNLRTLPFDRVVLDILENNRLVKRVQVINGLKPERLLQALNGEHVGTLIRAD